MKTKPKKKKKLKIRVVFIFLLLILLAVGISYSILHTPTKRIIVKGNVYTKESDIIIASGYSDYPYLYSKKTSDIKNDILKNPFITDVKINKTIFGELKINVVEAKPIFYSRHNNKLVLSNHKEVDFTNSYGVPSLINYVPDTLYERLIDEFANIDSNVITLINEIEYQPWKNENAMIDETRFLLRMNDGNHIYINLIHMQKLNNYIEIYASLEDKKGVLYLDSSSDKISFSVFKY